MAFTQIISLVVLLVTISLMMLNSEVNAERDSGGSVIIIGGGGGGGGGGFGKYF